jgi:tetratricopeptide (TPR) repeat protein
VALGSQLRERRVRTHAAVARALEAARPDRLDENAALLGYHHEAAGNTLDAARWHRRAAEWLVASDLVVSNAHWKRVYELARSGVSTPEALGLVLSACGRLVVHSCFVGLPNDERDRLATEGRELAERLGDRAGLFTLELGLGVSRILAGWSSEGPLPPSQRAVEIAKDLTLDLQVTARFQLSNTLFHMGRLADGLRATEETLALAGTDLEFGRFLFGVSIANFALWQKASLLMWLGRPAEAARCFERSRGVARERNDHMVAWAVNTWSGPAFEELTGIRKQGLARCKEAVELAERMGTPFARVFAWLYLGWAWLMHGQIADALDLLLRADHLQREGEIGVVQWNLGQALLAEAHLAAGDAANARIVANRSIVERDTWVFELRAHLARSRVLRALDGADARSEIEASLARAEVLLESSGARAFAPFIVEERARLAAVLGNEDSARDLLRRTRELFGQVEATGHVERLTAELGA